jgi:hypothetical protein
MQSPSYSYSQIAESFELWQEYVDPQATTTREEFEAMNHADRVALQVETFGPEVIPPTVDTVLASCQRGHIVDGKQTLGWKVEGGQAFIPASELRLALEEAYDPCMADWPALVMIDA